MTSSQIRQSFLDFFRSKGHTVVPSSSLLPDSPNLLFTNAGMNQFVPIFLGERRADVSKWAGATPGLDTRAADTQKCIRAGGKHNDLEDVGLDTYHHTFFEMLGNWSFGDYFKKEAIDWAWELITEIWKFPANRLYATVYSPDKSKGDPSDFDQEAWDVWAGHFRRAGLDPKIHIVSGNKKDNFWMMGDTGPCGPCSELHVDLTPAGDTQGALVNKGDARCIEIWNLVFIQFNARITKYKREEIVSGHYIDIPIEWAFDPLSAKHVDTGMGFERVTSIIQGTKNFTDFPNAKISNYETDIFRPIFDEIEKLSGKQYTSTLPQPVSAPASPSSYSSPSSSTTEKTVVSPAPGHALDSSVPGSATVPVAAVGVPPTAPAAPVLYHKRRLPHFERPWSKYMATFSTHERRPLSPRARDLVLKSLLFGHHQNRYQIYVACVMPDHVHLLFEPQIKERSQNDNPVFWGLTDILHSIKSFTAHEINKLEGGSGQVWENESFDWQIRGEADLWEKFKYVCANPGKDGLVKEGEDYAWLWTPDQASTARDAQQGDRDGRAPRDEEFPTKEQIQIDVAFRVIADHIRTLSFAIADGILPGNNDRNYVLRRILRRAISYGRTLGFQEPFFYKLVNVLASTMGSVFPEIRTNLTKVKDVIFSEEASFNKTIDRGLAILTHATERGSQITAAAGGEYTFHIKDPNGVSIKVHAVRLANLIKGETKNCITGEFAFLLYDTYGFPVDLTALKARERGLLVDFEGFNICMEMQRARARAAQKKTVIELSQIEAKTPTHFLGYDHNHIGADVQEVVVVKDKTVVVVNNSVCYAEMGGQAGDTGELESSGHHWRITNTQKSGATWLHFIEGGEAPQAGAHVTVKVDGPRRAAIERHHTVTHLLHWALHEVVSRDATQKGSSVGPDKLTFDFNSAALTPAQIAEIEKLVNARVRENAPVSWGDFPYADVKGRPEVMQFFGDKYGDVVRVVQIGGHADKDAHGKLHPRLDGYSMELCGGTHVRQTGDIGLFKILHESAIAAGVRRIEAVAGEAAATAVVQLAQEARELEKSLADLGGKFSGAAIPLPAGTPDIETAQALDQRVRDLQQALTDQKAAIEKSRRAEQQKNAAGLADNLAAAAIVKGALKFIVAVVDAPPGSLRDIAVQAGKKIGPGVVVLGCAADGKTGVVALCSPEAIAAGHAAGKIVGDLCARLGGKGGGKPDFAQGGGKDAAQLDAVLKNFREQIR